MHLIERETLKLVEVTNEEGQDYAILSHRWEKEEVLYEDMQELHACTKVGLDKVKTLCDLSILQHLKYVWVDTCCIDKRSSAELSEAINSMYKYYQSAKICVTYLSDVHASKYDSDLQSQFEASLWFTRCWTLQELIASENLVFYNSKWEEIGSKADLAELISEITLVDTDLLSGKTTLEEYSIAERMSWASRRQATRPEDVAYSLMGIFDVNMPMLYGEGSGAFRRLQEEILRYTDDETIFAWTSPLNIPSSHEVGLLAPSPLCFEQCRYLKSTALFKRDDSFVLTNRGLSASLMLAEVGHMNKQKGKADMFLALLNASIRQPRKEEMFIGIFLVRVLGSDEDFVRIMRPQMNRFTCQLLEVKSYTVKSLRVRVRHKGTHIRLRPLSAPVYGFKFDAGVFKLMSSRLNTGATSSPLTNPFVLEQKSTFTEIGEHEFNVQRIGSGAICEMQVKDKLGKWICIHLGVDESKNPVCLIWDDFGARGRSDKSIMTDIRTHALDPSLLYGLCIIEYREIHRTPLTPMYENREGSKLDYVPANESNYTGFWAFEGRASETVVFNIGRQGKKPTRRRHVYLSIGITPVAAPGAEHKLWRFRIDFP